ncbi:MAG: hypothetical protein K2N71_04425 [Oscillospiraceae bacterium]|nr:hypothetical protein [Oscillospiraceae bacterium]
MKSIAIVYSSKYGHTKQYADWLKEDVDADAIDISKFNITQMLAYKLVIFACGVYGDKLSIMDFVKKNVTAIPTQKTMVMAVGWYTNDSKEAAEKLINDNYPPEFKGKVPMYVVNSGINKKQVSKMDSVKLVAAKLAIEKKDGRSSDDINALGILNGYSDPTSKDNLASIKKGIDELLNPPQPEPEPKAAPAAKAAAPAPAPKAAPSAPAATAAPAPKPAAKPANDADALANSVEEAFKHLGAKPVIHNPEPPKPEPKAEAPAPAPAAEEQSAEPVIKFNANGKVVVSSVLDAINSLNGTPPQSAPKPEPMVVEAVKPAPAAEVKPAPVAEATPVPAAEVKPAPVEEPKPAPVAEVKPEPVAEPKLAPVAEPKPEPAVEVKPAPVAEPNPEPVAEVKPEPVPEPKPEPAKKTNSYMELFAKRRRASAEETAFSAPVRQAAEPVEEIPAPQPEPVPAPAPIPRPGPTPEADLDFGGLDFGAAASTSASSPTPEPQPAPAASGELDLDSYDFIGESKPSVSSRAMNAVQALAKAKEDAEREAAQKAAEQERIQNENYDNAEQQGFEMPADDDDGIIVEASAPADYEEESDGLEAFEFTNDFDYDVESELDIKFVEPEALEPVKQESKNNLDIKKLQEGINASIESNRAAKEKMIARYNKKKEEVHNPFAVQFEEDEDKKKRKSKKAASEPKFLEDPIDPDIFFSKPNKETGFNTGSMPEIKFKH